MSTEALEQFVRDVEDAGCEVSVDWHDDYWIIRHIVVDGVVIENDDYWGELEDVYLVMAGKSLTIGRGNEYRSAGTVC